MDAKEILSKVKEFFADLQNPATPVAAAAPPAAPAAPQSYPLKDGGEVMIDRLEVGGIVMIDGNPALPGDIELADGTKITIADNGAIAAITPGAPAAPAAPGTPELDMGQKFSAFETATNEKFGEYETKFASYEQKFTEYEVKLGKATKVIEQLLQLSQLIVDQPAAAPDTTVKTANIFKEDKRENDKEFINNLSKNLF